jgi:tyrosyl-tRNA synthetase
VYCGFDPTAASLHVGSLLALLCLARARHAGLPAVALVGGATARIGDPSGRSTERPELALDTLEKNISGIEHCIRTVLENAEERLRDRDQKNSALPPMLSVVDNAQWYNGMSAVQLICDIGRHFRLQVMLSRDSVKSRLQAEGGGLSFTEFAYQVSGRGVSVCGVSLRCERGLGWGEQEHEMRGLQLPFTVCRIYLRPTPTF